jgi:hypothetical protein
MKINLWFVEDPINLFDSSGPICGTRDVELELDRSECDISIKERDNPNPNPPTPRQKKSQLAKPA